MQKRVVAIDGPAGSGKSSVSKELARRFHFGYLDTGAAYRALAWATLNGLDFDSLETGAFESKFDYQISIDPDDFWVRVGEHDVTEAIRSTLISESVSSVAKIPSVREFMKRLTRKIVADNALAGTVVEGRDITTVVFPDADSRILLTASEQVRLQRRSKEISGSTEVDVTAQVSKRDASDSKIVDFLNAAEGVALVDSSELDFEQTVEAMSAQIEADLKERA